MTDGRNCGEGRPTWLRDCRGLVWRPSLIYIGGGEGRQPAGTPRVAESPLGSCPWPTPFPCMCAGGRQGEADSPFNFLPQGLRPEEVRANPLWAGVLPSFGPYGPLTSRGFPEPLPVIQIASSYISYFTSGPFRSSLSCP